MSHKLTKEELDEQFELFMKESVSDDSEKQLAAKSSQKSAQKQRWWQDDEPSEGGTRREEMAKSRFIKAKKSHPENTNVAEAFYKPVPKPRCKPLDKPVQLDNTHRDAVVEVSQAVERHRTPSDGSDSLQCVSGERSPDETLSDDAAPASSDSQSPRDRGDGLLRSGMPFRKSLRKSVREEEEEDPGGLEEDTLGAAVLSRDDIELEDSVMVPAANTTSIGLDTIEEEEEKARFFAQLEAGALSTIDYSKLNRELDSTSPAIATNVRKADEAVEQSDDQREARVTETIRQSPAYTGSPHYSEDFEEEEDGKEPLEEKSKMSPILAKVSLHDSLDSTGREDRRKDTAGSLDRGQPYVQSGGSEMEALHEAYRQIQVVEDPDDHNHHYSSLEGRGWLNRAVSPSSPPQPATQSLQPASTNESELPTAEELMRPIRPELERSRGFTLQPVSAVGKTPRFSETTSSESQLKRAERTAPAAGRKGARVLTGHKSSSQDPPNLTWSLRQEVERLMHDPNNYSCSTSSQAARAKKQQASRGSTISHSSTSSMRKPAVAPVRGRRAKGRPAGTSRSSGLSRAAATTKTQPSVSCPLQHPQEKDNYTEPGVKVSSELVASVQSLVSVLQQQIDISIHQEVTGTQEVRGPQETRLTDHPPNNNLRSAEEASQKKKQASDSGAEGKQHIDKEIQEQEMLIKGYQQENEKLCLQMKAQQVKSKSNEEDMFNENQRLLNELAFTREQLSNTSRTVGNVCLMDHTQRITDLLAHMNTFQRNEAKLSADFHRVKHEKQALEVDMLLMKKERDLAKAQTLSASGDKTFEMCVLEEKHRDEVVALKKKLQWFAENQDLLDRDAGRLKAATAEIHQLKEQVQKLKMDVGKRSSDPQTKAKEKAVDNKRMQDLERQVKELEQILRRRNPNSLPALIYAAAAAGGCAEDVSDGTSPPSKISALLERRIQRLEAELESHDDEAKRSLRAMEQQFHRIKLRYEQQISELEQQLQQKLQLETANSAAEPEPWMSQVLTLEGELQRVKGSHQEKEKSLHHQIESLQQQLKLKPQPSPGRHQRQAEAAFGARIERLNKDLASKTQTIQELCRTVERLQKERRSMLSVPKPQAEPCSTETRRQAGLAKALCSAPAADTRGGEETFPAAHYEKTYQPTVFTGSHISEVLQDNEALKQRLEHLELQTEQEGETLKADAVQAKEELCRLKEHSAEQLSSMKAEQLRVLDQLRASHALEHSSSKVAELANKLSAQEIMVKHLKEQLKEMQGAKDALAISRTREDALQKQLSRLLKDLKEAKDAQSPEVKLLCSLESKILSMELRHQHREKELQQVIGGSWQRSDADQQSEVELWKRVAQDKSRELEVFRLELDSILDILRHLQRQGVVLPTPDSLRS